MAAREHRETHDIEQNTEGDSINWSRNFLRLECQQVGFWCQHIWFGPLVPSWFCRTTNQAQLCTPPEVDFESSRSQAKSESRNKPSRQCWAVLPTGQYCRNSFLWWMYEINHANRLSHVWVHIVIALAISLTNQRMSGLPNRAKYEHFKTICEQTCDDSPTDSSSSCLNWWSSKQWLETLYNSSIFVCQLAVSLKAFSSTSLHVVGPRHRLCGRFSHPGNFSVAPREIRDSNIFPNSPIVISFGLHSRRVHPKYTWLRNEVGSSTSALFINFFHMGTTFCFFPIFFYVIHENWLK